MSDARSEIQFGTIALKLKLCTHSQIDECVRLQDRMRAMGVPPKRLGELMMEQGYLSETQVLSIMKAQVTGPGAVQIGNYQILAKIGQGAMGSIYKAKQLSMDRIVAVKVLSPKYASLEKFRERFLVEARAVAKLNHPNIIQGIDVGTSNGIHYFVMEFVDGPTVGELLRRGGALDEKRAVNIAIQITRALHHAHQHGIIHRDIKPDNIMITRENSAKLCDLGLAKVTSAEGNEETRRVSLGTPFYISPEQARGDGDVDTRSDIYSLGATLYHMSVGHVPFPGSSMPEVIAAHLHDPPVPLRQRNPLVSAGVEAVVLKMMQKDRAKRHQTPQELLAALEAVSGAGPTSGLPPTPTPLPRPPVDRNKLIQRVRRREAASYRH